VKEKLKCILLVDDDAATNYLHKRVVKEQNCTENIVTAENGEAALEYLRQLAAENKPPPELIFLDINMPIVNAWEFLEMYKDLPEEQKSKTVIVMLTTSLNPEDQERAGGFSEIASFKFKPLDKGMLTEALEKIA
jgi:CheY-like chemotaxis protein